MPLMKTMHHRLLLLVLVVSSGSGADFTHHDSSITKDDLDGTWDALNYSVEANVKGVKWVFAGDKLTLHYPGSVPNVWQIKRQAHNGQLTIDMKFRTTHWLAIYEIKGDLLRICESTSVRPTQFKAASGGTYLLTFKRSRQ